MTLPVPSTPHQLPSEQVVLAAPMSFAGSLARLWPLSRRGVGWRHWLIVTGVLTLILLAWTLVLCWYLIWGLWLVPYRLIRRGQRKREREARQHRELLDAIERDR